MALRNTPTFESDDETVVVETPKDVAAKVEQAAPAQSTAVAVAAPKNTGVSLLSNGSPIKQMEWAIPAVDLEGMGIGVFPRITVGKEGFSIDKTKDIGKEMRIEIISYNPVWLVTTGETDNKEADKLIRSSYDGVNLKGGEGTIAAYVERLKTVDGYSKAGSKQYMEMYCRVQWAKDLGDVPEDEQQIYQLSLPPTSVGQFQRFVLESALRKTVAENPSVVTVRTEKRVSGSNTYAVAVFSTK